MDAPGAYVWWWYKQHISRREIEKMKKNMKKVPVIQLKKEIYHDHEIYEAEKILQQIDQEENLKIPIIPLPQQHLPWYKKILHSIYHYFNSSR